MQVFIFVRTTMLLWEKAPPNLTLLHAALPRFGTRGAAGARNPRRAPRSLLYNCLLMRGGGRRQGGKRRCPFFFGQLSLFLRTLLVTHQIWVITNLIIIWVITKNQSSLISRVATLKQLYFLCHRRQKIDGTERLSASRDRAPRTRNVVCWPNHQTSIMKNKKER